MVNEYKLAAQTRKIKNKMRNNLQKLVGEAAQNLKKADSEYEPSEKDDDDEDVEHVSEKDMNGGPMVEAAQN